MQAGDCDGGDGCVRDSASEIDQRFSSRENWNYNSRNNRDVHPSHKILFSELSFTTSDAMRGEGRPRDRPHNVKIPRTSKSSNKCHYSTYPDDSDYSTPCFPHSACCAERRKRPPGKKNCQFWMPQCKTGPHIPQAYPAIRRSTGPSHQNDACPSHGRNGHVHAQREESKVEVGNGERARSTGRGG